MRNECDANAGSILYRVIILNIKCTTYDNFLKEATAANNIKYLNGSITTLMEVTKVYKNVK
jgi:hypothetical protein